MTRTNLIEDIRQAIAGSDSGPSSALDALPQGTALHREVEAVLGTSSGGYQPLTVVHLLCVAPDFAESSYYYLTHGYSEGYRAELYASLDALCEGLGHEPLRPAELAALRVQAHELRTTVYGSIATVREARQADRPADLLGALSTIEQRYLQARLGPLLTTKLLRTIEQRLSSNSPGALSDEL